MPKPKFYQAVLKPIQGDVLKHAYGQQNTCTLTERMESEECKCPDCGKNKWMLLPKEGVAVTQGGKPYIECLTCGYVTHL